MIIVIEGGEGAGTSTQIKRVYDYLIAKGIPVVKKSYPDKTNEIGKMIYKMLNSGFKYNLDFQFLLYATDMVKDREELKDDSKVFLLGRYFTSTITYQVVKGFPLEKALRFAEDYGIPKPDLVIYIDVPVEVGIERKKKDKGNLDVHESDIELLKKVREKYLENAKNNVFGKWIVINGNKSIDEVTQDIIDVIGEFLDLS